MPIYEYACKDCGYTFDALQKMSAEPLVECPECGKPELKKLVSAPNFRLKGSGWYETDFKKDNRRNLVEGAEKKVSSGEKSDADGKKKDGSDKDKKVGDSKAQAKTTQGDGQSGGGKPGGGKPANDKSGSI
jgi:putative FmdB family regulatory protein